MTSPNVRLVSDAIRRFTQQRARAVAELALEYLREDTPKKTGAAAAGWYIQAGPATGPNFNARIGPVVLVNEVPYINKLNNGSSEQAPAGFVQLALIRASANIGGRIA